MSKADSTLTWFKEAKFGMFIHFQAPREGKFNPGLQTAEKWARIAREAGMKYIVLTTKHSHQIPLWESSFSNRDITDRTSFKRDLVKELNAACKANGLRMGSYYNIGDSSHPLYTDSDSDITGYVDYLYGMMEELCELHQPILIWFDASRRFRDPADKPLLRQQEMVEMLNSYGTLSNSRLGDDDALKFVNYLTMNDNMAPDFKLGVPWESAVTMTKDGSWHSSTEEVEIRSTKDLLHRLINAAGNGGNLLLNVGPDKEGIIPKNMEERLREMGKWVEKNGEAIFRTKPGPYPYPISWGSITQRKKDGNTNLYLNVVEWPETGKFTLFGLNNQVLNSSFLASGESIGFASKFDALSGQNIITLDIPKNQPDEYVSVIKLVVAGDAVMDQDYLQLTDGKVLLDTYNAHIHDLEYVPGKPVKAIDMKMFTVPDRRPMQPGDHTGPWDYQMYKIPGEGIMPGRGLTVTGFDKKGQALSWDFKVYETGSYDIAVICHVRDGTDWEVDGSVRAYVAGQSVENQLIESKRIKTITMPHYLHLYSIIGTVNIDAPGSHTLTLEVASDFKGKAPNIKGVTLIPKNNPK